MLMQEHTLSSMLQIEANSKCERDLVPSLFRSRLSCMYHSIELSLYLLYVRFLRFAVTYYLSFTALALNASLAVFAMDHWIKSA